MGLIHCGTKDEEDVETDTLNPEEGNKVVKGPYRKDPGRSVFSLFGDVSENPSPERQVPSQSDVR